MTLRVAVPLLAICLASPAITNGEQVVKGRGYRQRDGGGQAAEKSGGDTKPNSGAPERTADTSNRPAERRTETRTAERRGDTRTVNTVSEPERVAVPRDNNNGYVVTRRRDDRPVIYQASRYYPPARYDYWTRHYYRWSPIGYAPWPLIFGSIGYANFGFYGGPNAYALGPYYYGYNGYGSYPWPTGGDTGAIRLQIRPRDAEVFVDGYYAGVVDDFDGRFQSLKLLPGGHRIEIRMPGFHDLELDVHVQPGRTITLDRDLRFRP